MPLKEYECSECQHYFEELQEYDDLPLTMCPKCGKKTLQKIFSIPRNPELKTVGAVADYNASKMTSNQKLIAMEQYRTNKGK